MRIQMAYVKPTSPELDTVYKVHGASLLHICISVNLPCEIELADMLRLRFSSPLRPFPKGMPRVDGCRLQLSFTQRHARNYHGAAKVRFT